MKKRECAIVQDLLVLYEDNVLQEESMQMVEEHIRGCEECMRIYENMGKELRVTDEDAEHSEKQQKEQEDAAKKIMSRLSRSITYKNAIILGSVLTVLLVVIIMVNELCNDYLDNDWGIAGMIYTIPADEVEITELYQLKNGDIYCTLKTEKQIGIREGSAWILPDNDVTASTDEAKQEIRFRQRTPWEWDGVEYTEVSMLFATEREGELAESREKVVQRCSEISYLGKSDSDRLIIWQSGQTVKEAPEEIERQAILEYVRDDQVEKAIQECEKLGWDSDEEIARAYQADRDIYHMYGSIDWEENVIFKHNYSTIWVN